MKYFTPELYARLQLPGRDDMNAADAAWDHAVDQYEEQLQRVRPHVGESVRRYLDGCYLHDATLLSMAKQGSNFLMTLRLDAPPHDLILLTFANVSEPNLNKQALPRELQAQPTRYLFNEVDLVSRNGPARLEESILFSNGWELRISYSDVQVSLAQPVYPAGDSNGTSTAGLSVPQTV